MKWLKPLLLLAALGHIAVGLYFLYAVDAVARLVGFDLLNTGSRGELRSMEGGLVVAIGAMILRGAFGGRFGRQWLYAAGIIYTGLLAGRVVSLGMDGLAAHTVFAGLFEAALVVLFFWSGAEVGRSATIAGDAPELGGSSESVETPATPRSLVPPLQAETLPESPPIAKDDVAPDVDGQDASDRPPGSAGSGE